MNQRDPMGRDVEDLRSTAAEAADLAKRILAGLPQGAEVRPPEDEWSLSDPRKIERDNEKWARKVLGLAGRSALKECGELWDDGIGSINLPFGGQVGGKEILLGAAGLCGCGYLLATGESAPVSFSAGIPLGGGWSAKVKGGGTVDGEGPGFEKPRIGIGLEWKDGGLTVEGGVELKADGLQESPEARVSFKLTWKF